MERAIALATENVKSGRWRAVWARSSCVMGESCNPALIVSPQRTTRRTGEIVANSHACNRARSFRLAVATSIPVRALPDVPRCNLLGPCDAIFYGSSAADAAAAGSTTPFSMQR